MPVTVRVGAVHLGWDVVSVAAGGGGVPIRPVQVEGVWTPPAYLLADSSGRLHTAGVERNRPDLGMAIADVRDILGHPQIVVAGATWPAELVFRARLYNPLTAIGKHLRGKPDLVALPFPDGWPDEKVELYAALVEQLDVVVEPLPESVALSGYVRALGLVHPPDRARPRGIGATGVYSDGRTVLVVAVHGDDEQPTESVDVPIEPEAMRDARSADNVVIEVMAAARSIGADTSTVLLAGNVCFNDALRLAFQNHLGHRMQVADHPMHALVLGAAHLLVTESEAEGSQPPGGYPEYQQGPGEAAGRHADSSQWQADAGPRHMDAGTSRTQQPPSRSFPGVQYGPGYPTHDALQDEVTTRIGRDEMSRGLPPHLAELGSRFTRPPSPHAEGGPTSPPGDPAHPSGAGPFSPQGVREQSAAPRHEPDGEEGGHRKGKLWNKMKGNIFGTNAVVGAMALALIAVPLGDRVGSNAAETADAATGAERESAACSLTPYAINQPKPGISSARDGRPTGSDDCGRPGIDTLRYVVPGPPGAMDPGPPFEI